MIPTIIIGVNIVMLAAVVVAVRFWIRRQPDAFTAHYRLCRVVMWLGFLLVATTAVISFISPYPVTGLLLTPVGLLIVTSMLLKRKELAHQSDETRKKKAV